MAISSPYPPASRHRRRGGPHEYTSVGWYRPRLWSKTRKLLWRELKVAAVYAAVPPARRQTSLLRTRPREYRAATAPAWTLALVDQTVRITYVARTEAYAHFGEHLWAELRERGLGAPVTDLAVVVDGSPIWTR